MTLPAALDGIAIFVEIAPLESAVVEISDAFEPKTPATTVSPGVKPRASTFTGNPGFTRSVETISLTARARTALSLGGLIDTTDVAVAAVAVVAAVVVEEFAAVVAVAASEVLVATVELDESGVLDDGELDDGELDDGELDEGELDDDELDDDELDATTSYRATAKSFVVPLKVDPAATSLPSL